MTAEVALWRIAVDAPDYEATDLSGTGAERSGGRWNRAGAAMLYASTSRALACLETLVHLGPGVLPLNRYLVRITVPQAAWSSAEELDPARHVGWDAQPAGKTSLDWGMQWLQAGRSLLARVPSIVVPEEANVLINPQHADIARVRSVKVRKWLYDSRLPLPAAASR